MRNPTTVILMTTSTHPLHDKTNPGLATYDITGYTGTRGKNFYSEDRVLQRIVVRLTKDYTASHKKALSENLTNYGQIVGGILDELVDASHKEGKYGEIVKYDRTGVRIDEIKYSFEQKEIRRIAYQFGIVNLDAHPDWKHPFTLFHKMALAYLSNMLGEAGFCCPLAMTDGMIEALKAIGTEEQKKKYLPLVWGKDSASHLMAGQYVTERVGGSNVALNRTVASKGDNGKWVLNGEKWFCSNPGDLWVTTAKIEGTSTIGLFLVPRIKENGELNGHHLLRKKDIIGSRGKVTAEIVYEDVEAEELGRTAHGLANLIKYVIKTSRIHVGIAALGASRRAYMEAYEYSLIREAYGKKISQFPAVMRSLSEMKILQTALTHSVFLNLDYIEKKIKAEQVITPLLKYISSTHATWQTKEAIILLGGNGILGDFSCLPRLHNDSIINETWEGTHHIIADHVLHAFGRPQVKKSFEEELQKSTRDSESLGELSYSIGVYESKKDELDKLLQLSGEWIDMNRIAVCELIYGCFALSSLMEEAVAFKKDFPEKENIYALFANGYAEILYRGKSGFADPGGIFNSLEKMDSIIKF